MLHVEQALCMSIVRGESQWDVRTRPYFRGRAVCSHADIGIGSVRTNSGEVRRARVRPGRGLCRVVAKSPCAHQIAAPPGRSSRVRSRSRRGSHASSGFFRPK